MVESVEEEFNTARSHVELLQEALDKQKAEANDLAEKLVQYHILQHDAESNKQLYDGLLQKLKEAGITAGLRSSNIRVVDPALAPAGPSRPQKARNILLAFLVGLVGRRRPGAVPRIPRQYREVPRRHRIADWPPFAGGRARSAGLTHQSQPILAAGARSSAAIRVGAARGIVVLHSAEVPNLRSVPRVAHFPTAFASGSSAASDPGDERVAARRENHRRGESGGHASRSLATARC